jgi:hypothetical protein
MTEVPLKHMEKRADWFGDGGDVGRRYGRVLTGWGRRVVGSDWLSVASVGWLVRCRILHLGYRIALPYNTHTIGC